MSTNTTPPTHLVRIPPAGLEGDLVVPDRATGIVIFAHGSGSSRQSPRNRAVARYLNEAGFATLLMDLLTPQEDQDDAPTGHLRFDIRFLADRLRHATGWIDLDTRVHGARIGYFGASTGAAAALAAAADHREISAIVSRGGRPDLAGEALPAVLAPTLFLVGGEDDQVLEWNRAAQARMQVVTQLEVIAGASHLFEEPGALERVAELAADWFRKYLVPPSA
jgi:dienelactone hydrolase